MPGGQPSSPHIQCALWRSASLDGTRSGREIAQPSDGDDAHCWICGGVLVDLDALKMFDSGGAALTDEVLTNNVASPAQAGATGMACAAHGLRLKVVAKGRADRVAAAGAAPAWLRRGPGPSAWGLMRAARLVRAEGSGLIRLSVRRSGRMVAAVAGDAGECFMSGSKVLPTSRLEPGTALAQTQPSMPGRVGLDAPALSVMTDLTQLRAATTAPSATLAQAEQTMIYQGVRMLFVVAHMPHIEGLVTTTDLHGERQMRAVHERGLRYDELCVADVMTPLAMLDAVDFDRMKSARVGDVIDALKDHGRNHLLVMERPAGLARRVVRGVISRAQIERQTGVTIDLLPIASSFSEIKQALD